MTGGRAGLRARWVRRGGGGRGGTGRRGGGGGGGGGGAGGGGGGPVPRADLPGYAFQRQRYWLPAGRRAAGLDGAGTHPLLGGVLELADGSVAAAGRLSLAAQPWLADHMVHGSVVVPGAVVAELAWHAGMLAGCAV